MQQCNNPCQIMVIKRKSRLERVHCKHHLANNVQLLPRCIFLDMTLGVRILFLESAAKVQLEIAGIWCFQSCQVEAEINNYQSGHRAQVSL